MAEPPVEAVELSEARKQLRQAVAMFSLPPNPTPGQVIVAEAEADAYFDLVEPLIVAAARAEQPGGGLLGYTVAVNRPSSRDPERWEIVGMVHREREPAENHQAYCEMSAEANPERYGSDVRYEVVEVRRSEARQ